MPLRLRKLWLACSAAALLLTTTGPRLSALGAGPAVTLAAGQPYSPTEVLVRFRPGANANDIAQGLAAQGAQAQADPALAKLGYTLVTVPAGQVPAALAALQQNPAVERAEPNYILAVADDRLADTIPTDPKWDQQYGPVNIQAPQVWDILTGTQSVVIAIIDTGVDLDHPDLDSKIWTNPGETGLDASNNDKRFNGEDDDSDGYVDDWRGWDFTASGLGDNDPQDAHGHGTHVAGIAGAATNNGIGIAGVNWSAPLMVVRVLDATGNGTNAEVAAGIVYATDQGAKILNLSLGALTLPLTDTALLDAVNYAYNHGALVVAAAGNYGSQGVIYPAKYDHALAIANTNSANNRNSTSSYGPEVDLSAPGTAITSTLMNNGYGLMTGTSMATPHVSGVAALLATLPQFDTPDKIRAALEATALDVDVAGWDQKTGYGVIQAYAAALYDPNNLPPTPTPVEYAVRTSDACPGGVSYDWDSGAA
jgi:thermitase